VRDKLGPSIKKELKVLGKHSSIYGLASVLNGLVGFLLLPLYTRYLTTADYGTLEILYFVATIISITMSVGIGEAMSRFYFDRKEQSDRDEVVSTTYIGYGIFSIVCSVVLISCAGMISDLVFDTRDRTMECALVLATLGLNFLMDTGFGYFRVVQKSVHVTVHSISKLLLTISLNILFLVGLEMGVMGILLGTLIANAVIGIAMTIPILRKIGLRFSAPVLKQMVKYGLPLIPSSMATYLIIAADRYFVKEYVGLADAGLYTLGYKFGVLVGTFVTAPFNTIWYPRRFEYFNEKGSEQMYARIFTYFMAVVTLGVLGVSLYSEDVIMIMTTEEFWPAFQIVPVIALSQLFHSLFYHFSIGISYFKKTVYFTYINILTAAVNLSLNFLLIPSYGIWGAAWSTVITYIVRASLTFYFSNRLFPLEFETVRVLKLFLAAGLAYLLGCYIDLGSPWLNIVIKIGPLVGFAGLLYALKFFTAKELSMARDGIGKLKARLSGKQAD